MADLPDQFYLEDIVLVFGSATTSRPAMPPTTMRGEVEERRKGLSSGSWSDIFGLDALAYWYSDNPIQKC